MKHPFSFLFFPTLLLILVCKIGIAEESNNQHYPVQITTTSIGDGLWAGASIKKDFLLGLQFTNHSTNFTREEIYDHSIDQQSQVVLIFNRWNPAREKSFFLQSGIAHRKQYENAVFRRDRYQGDTLIAYGRFGGVKVIWPEWAVNLGLGWHWQSYLGFSGGVGYGLLWSERPKMTIDSTYDWFVTEAESKYFQAQQEQTQNKLNQLAIWPLYLASIGWTF
ncbi:MAG: hypothetical protein VXZ27_07435 [SAR324 cluster bacterium]|nr:hypothetical protein [SAR324 cluster bacterium]